MKAYSSPRVRVVFVCMIFLLLGMVMENQAVAATQYEAENAALSGGANKNTNHSGYSGTGFVDGFFYSTTAQASFTVNMASAGSATVTLRYSAGNGSSTNTGLYVNGTKIKNITYNATTNWDTWANATETVTLNAGNNTIAYKAETSAGTCINIDYISVQATTTTYSLTINATNGTVTKSPNLAAYPSGTIVALTAVPATGYVFSGWSGDATGTTGTASITMNSSKIVTANFVPMVYALEVTASAGGTTSPTGTFTVNAGTAMQILAMPAPEYKFTNWTIVSGTATIANASSATTTVTLTTGPATIRANFAPTLCVLEVTNNGGGTTTPSGTTATNCGTATQISAAPGPEYKFTNWTVVSGTATIANSSSASTTVTLSGGPATIRANFAPTLCVLEVTNNGGGTTTPSGTTATNCGTATQISAAPGPEYKFTNWTVISGTATIANSSSASTTVTVTGGPATIRANFAPTLCVLEVTNNGGGTTTPSGTTATNCGTATQIAAAPGPEYKFTNWTVVSGTATIANSTAASTTVTVTGGPATIRANFAPTLCVLEVTNNGGGTTTPSGTTATNCGTATQIAAAPGPEYKFTNWTVVSGTATIANSSSASTTVTVTGGPATIRANFAPTLCVLEVTTSGGGTTTPSGTTATNCGTATQISASPGPEYTFSNWTVVSGTATIANSSSASTTVTLSGGPATIRANFIGNGSATAAVTYAEISSPVTVTAKNTVVLELPFTAASEGYIVVTATGLYGTYAPYSDEQRGLESFITLNSTSGGNLSGFSEKTTLNSAAHYVSETQGFQVAAGQNTVRLIVTPRATLTATTYRFVKCRITVVFSTQKM